VPDDYRECPMCGEGMRRQEREQVIRIPGTTEVKKQIVHEWICMECDHFEEAGSRGDDERE
jgi:rubredoxin